MRVSVVSLRYRKGAQFNVWIGPRQRKNKNGKKYTMFAKQLEE
jgi:hypothetical protein